VLAFYLRKKGKAEEARVQQNEEKAFPAERGGEEKSPLLPPHSNPKEKKKKKRGKTSNSSSPPVLQEEEREKKKGEEHPSTREREGGTDLSAYHRDRKGGAGVFALSNRGKERWGIRRHCV